MTTAASPSLRQRKKQRTRQAIIDAGTALFAEQGYEETTLAQLADAAEIAPSTFFNYFGSKADIVFGLHDAITESAREYLLERVAEQPATTAVVTWIADELPRVEAPFTEVLRRIPGIIAAVPELQAESRLRLARLEDLFAEAFARDLQEPAHQVRSRILAAIVLGGMESVWDTWYEQHSADIQFDPTEAFALKADYVARALDASALLIARLPQQ